MMKALITVNLSKRLKENGPQLLSVCEQRMTL